MFSVRLFATASLCAAAAFLPPAARAWTLTTLHSFGGNDGADPMATLLYKDGSLYGTTQTGGAVGSGTVFAVDATTGIETQVYAFRRGTDGKYPEARLLSPALPLYGTTFEGGASGLGTIFKINPTTGKETVVHSFAGPDGNSPHAGLV